MKGKIAFLLSCIVAFGSYMGIGCAPKAQADEVTILYTNDVHAYLDNDEQGSTQGLSYAHLSQMKKDLKKAGKNVLVVDAGDHIQGSVYGAMDQGQSVLDIMNGIYDVATLGNHEFDFGIARTWQLVQNAQYPYISCNFVATSTAKPILQPYTLLRAGDVQVGFVGITTPETISSTAPTYFQNGNGEYLYSVLDGEAMYAAVQNSIDDLQRSGADYIVALAHLGVDGASVYTSRNVIRNVSGLDAVIDGHSHTDLFTEMVKDEAGKDVLLTQTGHYLSSIGKMTISSAGIENVDVIDYVGIDEEVQAEKNAWVRAVNQTLGEKIATLGADLKMYDSEDKRLVRVRGTNLSEFIADGYYYYINEVDGLDCDVAFVNGGGVRAEIEAGDISYMDMKSTNPFGNMLCVVEFSGRQILDALEWGARSTTGVAGEHEEGAFLHAAGLTYAIDTTVESTVSYGDDNIWLSAPTGEYRVRDVKVYDKSAQSYVDLDVEKTYRVAGSNFTLKNQGDGFTMLNGLTVKDYIVEDYMALSAYAKAFTDTTEDGYADILSENSPLAKYADFLLCYEQPLGGGRIRF